MGREVARGEGSSERGGRSSGDSPGSPLGAVGFLLLPTFAADRICLLPCLKRGVAKLVISFVSFLFSIRRMTSPRVVDLILLH